jgi:hypothetical protein
VEILPEFPEDSVPPGILAIASTREINLMNFREQTTRSIPGDFWAVGVSSNGKWLSYVSSTPMDDEDVYMDYLVVESTNGEKQATLPFDPSWIVYDWIPWLDNERIWFPVNTEDVNPPTVLLNPFTGEQQLLLADYPNIYSDYYGPGNGPPLNFGVSNVSYDPSLRYVVYPMDDDGMKIALWDRKTKQIVAKIGGVGMGGPLPLWLPDGSGVVVAAQPADYKPYEWFLMGKNGEIRRLTYFGDLSDKYGLSQTASLSPDGRYLAFGLKGLTILDLQTLEIVNTCISNIFFSPIWSPDSQYLALHHWGGGKNSVLVLDFELRSAVTVFTDEKGTSAPSGWLDSGE